MKPWSLGTLIACLFLSPFWSWAQPTTLDEVVGEAIESHPQVRAARHRTEGARLRGRYAGAPLNPTVRLGETVGDPVEELINITQSFELGGQPGLRAQLALVELRFRHCQLQLTERDVALGVGRAYLELWISQQRHGIFQQRQGLYDKLELLSRRRYETGDIARNQYSRVSLERQRAQADVIQAALLRDQAEARLRTQLGRTEPLELAEVSLPPFTQNLEQVQAWAERLPEVQAARANWEASKLHTQLAQSEGSPTLGLSLYRSSFVRNTVAQGFQVSLSWTPWDYGQIEGEVVSRRAEQDALEAEIEQSQRLARQRLETVFQSYLAARQRRDLLQEQVNQSLQLAESAQKGFASGYWTLLDALDSQRSYRDFQLEYLSAESDHALAWLELTWLHPKEAQHAPTP